MGVREFVDEHYRHFNAGTLQRASRSLNDFLASDGKIFLTLAGAMSTAEIGRSLAQMIRAGHIAAISCTGANLEEDLFNLVAHEHYVHLPNYQDLTPADEVDLLNRHLNRVTDTCIPEEAAIRKIESHVLKLWQHATSDGEAKLPHSYFYDMLRSDNWRRRFRRIPTILGCWLRRKSTSRSMFLAGKIPRSATFSRPVVLKVWLTPPSFLVASTT